jgi:hypothetical protein
MLILRTLTESQRVMKKLVYLEEIKEDISIQTFNSHEWNKAKKELLVLTFYRIKHAE